MTKRFLTLLRHAKSSRALGPERDHERGLDERGERVAALMASYLAQRRLAPDLVLCSSAERARATLALILPRRDVLPEVRFEDSLYLAEAGAIRARLRRLGRAWCDVLVVGHNPGLQTFAATLARAADADCAARIEAKFPTCALARYQLALPRWKDLGPEAVRAVELVVPKSLV